MDWFLYDNGLRHERVKIKSNLIFFTILCGASKCFMKAFKACNFVKKKTLAHAFFCEFCEISKKTFFTEHLWAAASGKAKPADLGIVTKFHVYC